MMSQEDRGFNYGIGWGSAPKPPIYFEAMRRCQALAQAATQLQSEAWELAMSAREVRLASTGADKKRALSELDQKMKRYHNQPEEEVDRGY